MFLSSGSETSCTTEGLAKRLGLELMGSETLTLYTFGSRTPELLFIQKFT